jgi:hypothetical protein
MQPKPNEKGNAMNNSTNNRPDVYSRVTDKIASPEMVEILGRREVVTGRVR